MNGITRQKVIDLCRKEGIPVREKNFSLVDTYSADEAFLTGTFGAQTPVGSIDGRSIGTGKLGPTTEHIRKLYKLLIDKECGLMNLAVWSGTKEHFNGLNVLIWQSG
jgi:branched-chain amino acid aminotransferase